MQSRKRIGQLIRTLLDCSVTDWAKVCGVSLNTIYSYEKERFNSKKLDEKYKEYYDELDCERILTHIGLFKVFNKWEEYLEREE